MEQESRDQAKRQAGAQAGAVNPQAAERADRAEHARRDPKTGSNAADRAGLTPGYIPGYGRGSAANNANPMMPESRWRGIFPKVDPFGGTTPAAPPAGVPTPPATPAPFAGDPETQSALGITPASPGQSSSIPGGVPRGTSGLWPSPKVEWTGPSLLPQAGPGSASPWMPHDPNTSQFHVAVPVGSPNNTGADLRGLQTNPRAGENYWANTGSGLPEGTAPTTVFQPDPRLAALTASGGSARTPYGPIAGHIAPSDWSSGAPVAPAKPAAFPANPQPINVTPKTSASAPPKVDPFA